MRRVCFPLFVLWSKVSFIQFAVITYSGNYIFRYLIFITKSDISCEREGRCGLALSPLPTPHPLPLRPRSGCVHPKMEHSKSLWLPYSGEACLHQSIC